MEVEEKVDADQTTVGTETWPDAPGRGTPETRQNQTFVRDQSCPEGPTKDGPSVPEAGPGDASTEHSGSYWDRPGEEGVGSVSECPTLESSVSQSSNTVSVIVHIPGSDMTAGDAAAAVCSATKAGREETGNDNQSVSTATACSQTTPPAAKHAGRVIVTNVTINSLTVTFREARVAEGFFKGY